MISNVVLAVVTSVVISFQMGRLGQLGNFVILQKQTWWETRVFSGRRNVLTEFRDKIMQMEAIRLGQDGDASFPRYDDQNQMQPKVNISRSHAGRYPLMIEKTCMFNNCCSVHPFVCASVIALCPYELIA
jgi:hypothetical protein